MDTVIVKATEASMRAKDISIRDTGLCISLSFDDNIVLLNKLQISIVEVIKADTVRIEMGNGATSNVFVKSTDVVDPLVQDANDLRDTIWAMLNKAIATGTSGGGDGDGDCACAPLIQQTNDGIASVINVIAEGNSKADVNTQVLSTVADNIANLNQMNTDIGAYNYQKLVDVHAETTKVATNTSAGNDKLDNIHASASDTAITVAATNDLLSANHTATLQTLSGLKSELSAIRTVNNTNNDLLTALIQGNASVISNSSNGNQYLSSLDLKLGTNGFIGNVSRRLKTVTVQPAISTQAYAVGQVIGGIMTLTGALRAAILSGTWMGIQVVEKSVQKAPMDIVLFTSSPTAANFADKAVPNWTNDYDRIIGITNIVAANYSILSGSSGVCLGNLSKRVTAASANLYAVAICNGTPTYASASHLYFTFYFEQD